MDILINERKVKCLEKIVLYLENPNAYNGKNILIIDKDNNQVRVPNSSMRDYSKWNNYVFQNNSRERFISFKKDLPIDSSIRKLRSLKKGY